MASKVSGVIEKINVSGTERAIASTAYGYCETAASTAAKVVDMTDFKLYEGVTIHVKFANANSANNPTLNVNDTGAKAIVQYGTTAAGKTSETNGWYAGAVITLTYDGTSWVRDQGFNTNSTYSYMRPYGSTAGATAEKTGTAGWRFQLTAGKYFMFTQYYDNTAQSALTLNIGSTGAKPIYINGQPSSASNYTLPGGQYLVYYDGTNYHFRTDDKIPGNIAGNASTASSVALSGVTGADNLKTIEGLSGTGLLKKTATNTWTLDDNSYVTSSGITSVTIGATSPVQSSTSTAQTGSSASTTISLKDAYGDTKNPYGSKTKNYVLAAPSNANGAPSFRALVAADIPDLSGTYVKKVTSTDNAIVRFDGTGGQIQNSSVTINDTGVITTPSSILVNAYTGYNLCKFQTSNNCAEIVIKTKFRFVSSATMPTVTIQGYSYGAGIAFSLIINYYIYNNEFFAPKVISLGGLKPDVYLFKYTENNIDYVAIGLKATNNDKLDYIGFTVNATCGALGSLNSITDTNLSIIGWSIAFINTSASTMLIPAIDTDKCKKVPYGTLRTNVISADYSTTSGTAGKATAANLTSTTNAVAYYTDTAGKFGSKASANGALYATSANGALQWGTLPIAQGGTGKTSAAEAWTALGGGASGKHADSYFALASHNHAASDINSGTFDAARIPNLSWNKITSDKPDTATRWPKWNEINQSGAENLSVGSSDVTDQTEILTSYASNNGFSDASGKGIVYRRQAVHIYNYVKGKTDSLYVAKSAGVTNVTWDSTNKKITKTINGTTSDVVTAATLKDAINVTAADLGLSKAMRFIGVATVAITDGSTTDPVISGYSTKTAGDVIIDKDSSREYIWSTTGKWELLGGDSSYKTTQTAVTDPTASTSTSTTFIDTISQDANGVITATKKTLPKYAGSSSAGGAATSANALNFVHTNELLLGNADSQSGIHINHRRVAGGASGGNTAITDYYFKNGNGAITGVKIHAETFDGNATTATTATNLANNPSIQASANNANLVTITAGGKTSDAYTIPYAVTATTATWVGKGTHGAAITANEFTPAVGTMTVLGNVSNTSMSHSNNANAEIIIKAHPTSGTNYFEARLGFSSNGSIYHMPVNTTNWERILTETNTYAGDNATASMTWGGTYTLARINGTDIKVTMPSNPNTNTTYTFAEGSTNGAFSVTPSGGSAQSVSIHGLGTAAYKAVGDFAVASHSHSYLANTNAGAADRPIYITGNAAAQTTYRMAGTNVGASAGLTYSNDLDTGIWYVNGISGTDKTTLYNQIDGVIIANKYSASWISEIYQDYRTGQLAIRGKNNGTWADWRRVLDSTNYTDYAATTTGTNASGTWGISITGSAGSVAWANTGHPSTFPPTIGTTATTAAAGNHTHTISLTQTGTSTVNLAANTVYTLTAGGSSVVFKTPADGNTDTKVTQAYSTNNAIYPILMTATAGNTSTSSRGDTTAILNNSIYANPSTGQLNATSYKVDEAVTLQYNSNDSSLEFIFA